jgi:hypothetical protein
MELSGNDSCTNRDARGERFLLWSAHRQPGARPSRFHHFLSFAGSCGYD